VPTTGLADRVTTALQDRLGSEAVGVWFAPGRVNLIGEHTDYSEGFVLPFALALGTAVAAAPRADQTLRLVSTARPDVVEVPLDALAPGHPSGWAGYAAGMAWALREAGLPIPGADVAVCADVPQGAGLSSSASLECAVGVALTDLAGARLGRTELALAAQRTENEYVGVPCGVMDQMAAMHASAGHVVLLDTRSLAVRPVPLDLARSGLELLLLDTGAPHRLVSGEYAARRRECEQAARLLGVPALRDVADLDDALRRLPDATLRRRVRHVLTENARVLRVVHLLERGADPRAIGPVLTASHESLRADYEVTVPDHDVAVDAALAAGAHGARMTGAGFGGSVLALVDSAALAPVRTAVTHAFRRHGFDPPTVLPARAGAGARRLR